MNQLRTACGLGSSLPPSVWAERYQLGTAYRSALQSLFVAITVAGACLSSAFGQAPTPFAPPQTGLVLFQNLVLIDAAGGQERAGMDVLVNGERIERIFPDAEVDPRLLQKAKVVTLGGRFLIPGLIDAHVHLATPPNRRQAEALLRRDLYGGVTAVRDMADDLRAVGELYAGRTCR